VNQNTPIKERLKCLQRDRICTRCKLLLSCNCFRLVRWKTKVKRRSCCIDCERAMHRSIDRPLRKVKAGKRNPIKQHARNLLQSAIRWGKIIPQPCVKCGEKIVHGHHPDYSKPLDVLWLCRTHHMELHRKPSIRQLGGQK